tara:strand:- start:1499 stop:1681 length:183 start_codon:yes stop_codon:yes gene_type:complete
MRGEDKIAILEIARLACACIPDVIVDEMDISDEEFIRIRDIIQERVSETLTKENDDVSNR